MIKEQESVMFLKQDISIEHLKIASGMLNKIVTLKVRSMVCGLCGVLDEKLDDYHAGENIVDICALSWNEYSGIRNYPVPHPFKEASDAYMDAEPSLLYDRRTAYGKARYRLAEHCLKLVNKAIELMEVQP